MKQEDTIDFHIRWAWYNILRMYNLKAAEFDGSMALGYTLLNIDKEGTPSTKLGPKMGMEPRSLTRMIKGLEEKGLIEKKQDSIDKRSVKIFLTKEGKKIRDLSKEIVISFNQEISKEIGQKDLKTCIKVLNKLNKIIDREDILAN